MYTDVSAPDKMVKMKHTLILFHCVLVEHQMARITVKSFNFTSVLCRCGISAGNQHSCCMLCRPSPLWVASSGAPVVVTTLPTALCCWTIMSMCGIYEDPTSLSPVLMSTKMWLHVSVERPPSLFLCVCAVSYTHLRAHET